MLTSRYGRELEVSIAASQEAGEAVRDLYERSAATTYTKTDGSPVTDADLASDRIVRARISNAFPDDYFLTEEGVDDAARLGERRVWIVDPIDGTQQFVDRTGEFDVLIALVVEGRPVAAVLLQPTTGIYLAAEAGEGAWSGRGDTREPLRFMPLARDAAPRLRTSIWFNMPAGSAGLERTALRLGTITPGVSPYGVVVRHFLAPDRSHDALIGLPSRADQTMAWEWDFVAADLVVHEAGGAFTDVWGRQFCYNKPVPRNVGGLLMSIDPETHARILEALEPELPVAG